MARQADMQTSVTKEQVYTHRPWTQEACYAMQGHTGKYQARQEAEEERGK